MTCHSHGTIVTAVLLLIYELCDHLWSLFCRYKFKGRWPEYSRFVL